MEEVKDPGIKLFGRKIALPEKQKILVISGNNFTGDSTCSGTDGSLAVSRTCLEAEKVKEVVEEGELVEGEDDVSEAGKADKDHLAEEPTKLQDTASPLLTEESRNLEVSPESDDHPKTPPLDEETATQKPPKAENDQSDSTNSQQKTMKKPDKILPCPRCHSTDTKFCYYNNYNVNQPRHFCKSCQRYWTAGGTMRNMPVGAGRRKNKNFAPHCRHITISEALQAAQSNTPNDIHQPAYNTNGAVLSFGSDSSLCESGACAINQVEKEQLNGTINVFSNVDQGIVGSSRGGGSNDCSSSSLTTSNSHLEVGRSGLEERMVQKIHGFPSHIPCHPGVLWPYPWNTAVPLPAICHSGYPMPFYPAPYWNCAMAGAWSVPWLSPQIPTSNEKAQASGQNSSTLGKHSRDGDLLNPRIPEAKETPILVPKTLRIDDPDEAAKSSIWATLGIKNDSNSRTGMFKAFQAKREEKNHTAATSPMLQANPAALSRSLSFQERA
ncbi:hypothetical protein RJ639_042065 [Escallonia herrerae]|uniref:Dof-type domain-containing protein n=1 Tax=Escallonia herrerae TaxID=1293975 RepID=A0AA88WTT2_9ASTE|nr:hypothetical protein RJ639_042065 [Escallonia herrerae]